MKQLSANEIIQMYAKGERNFDNIASKVAQLRNVKLRGASFKNSNLGWSSFAGCDLADCDFSDSVLQWSTFENANLTNTNFTNADLTWCNLNNVTLKNTNFTKADFYGSLMFNINRGGADWKMAKIEYVAFSIEDLNVDDLDEIIKRLASMGVNVPFDLIARLERQIMELHTRAEFVTKQKSSYARGFGSTSGTYGEEKAFSEAFHGIYDAARQTLYGSHGTYEADKEGKKHARYK